MKNRFVILFASCFVMSQALAIEPVYDGENGIRAKIFETNCLACHSTELTGADRNGAPEADNFNTFMEALKEGVEAVDEAVVKMDMPPSSSGLPKLDEEQKQALKNWQAVGFPEKTLPTIYSSDSIKLTLPQVYLKDGNGDITPKWKAEMTLIPGSDPIQFELTDFGDIDASSTSTSDSDVN